MIQTICSRRCDLSHDVQINLFILYSFSVASTKFHFPPCQQLICWLLAVCKFRIVWIFANMCQILVLLLRLHGNFFQQNITNCRYSLGLNLDGQVYYLYGSARCGTYSSLTKYDKAITAKNKNLIKVMKIVGLESDPGIITEIETIWGI